MTASKMAQLSLAARLKKYGGAKGFNAHMKSIASKPRKRRTKVVIPTLTKRPLAN